MAQDWARPFYKKKAWLDCRAAYIKTVDGLCERCLKAQRLTPGKILHHKIRLTPENITDHTISLNWNHLEFVCKPCHEAHHHSEYQATVVGVMFDESGDLIKA